MSPTNVPNPKGPVEAKVKTATAATFFTSLILAILDWVSQNISLLGNVGPAWLSGLLVLIVPPAITYGVSYYTHHTARPDLPANGGVVNPPN